MKVHFSNLGCKLNQAELEALARRFHRAGHQVVGTVEEADLHVVNSCTVTHRAARDSRKTVRQGQRRRPGLKTVVTGCWATDAGGKGSSGRQRPEPAPAPSGGLEVDGVAVDLLVPNERKSRLLEEVHAAFPEAVPAPVPEPRAGAAGPAGAPRPPAAWGDLAFGNGRGLVAIEDGCTVGCTFCIIPSTRGRQVSRPLAEVVREVVELEAAGYREVILTGVQISHYRWQGRGLPALVEALLEATRELRLRLTSLAPWRFDEELFDLWRSGRLCRHIHMSLQSGADPVLARMKRPYTRAAYGALAGRIREAIPGVALTTDVIAGFPGETPEEFEDGLAFVEAQGFAKIHAFPYSPRPGTAAAALPDRVPPPEIRRRMGALLEVAARGEERFREAHRGAVLPVLWEERRRGRWWGTTDNYLRVSMPLETARRDLAGRLTAVRILEGSEEPGGEAAGLEAELVPAGLRGPGAAPPLSVPPGAP